MESIHKGAAYLCDQCQYIATIMSSLNIVVRKNYFPGLSQPRPWLAEIYLILILLQICYIFRIVYKSLVTPVTRY